jgi:hypothetical protein
MPRMERGPLALNRMIADQIEFHASQEVAISQQKRKRTEEPFGRGKTIGGLARPMLRGDRIMHEFGLGANFLGS